MSFYPLFHSLKSNPKVKNDFLDLRVPVHYTGCSITSLPVSGITGLELVGIDRYGRVCFAVFHTRF